MALRPTFRNGWDRAVYLLAQYRLVVAGALVMLGLYIGLANPSLPQVPEWGTSMASGVLILGPPSYLVGLRIANYLHRRNAVTVFEVDAVADEVEKYLVPTDVWKGKRVEGADPYPMNGGSAWGVRDFDWQPGTETLVVEGVWLSELEDSRLLTEKRHMRDMYGSLLEDHLTLSLVKHSVAQMGGRLQERVMNQVIHAHEKGDHLDREMTNEIFDEFSQEIEDLGTEDLPDIQDDPTEWEDPMDDDPAPEPGEQAVATDGGGES